MHTDKPMQIVKPFAGHESSKEQEVCFLENFDFLIEKNLQPIYHVT